jgi:hypothetical protein
MAQLHFQVKFTTPFISVQLHTAVIMYCFCDFLFFGGGGGEGGRGRGATICLKFLECYYENFPKLSINFP